MPDNRDYQRPKTPAPLPPDDEVTPVEGSPPARSLHSTISNLRKDLRSAVERDESQHAVIRYDLGQVRDHVIELKVETGKQTVILDSLVEAGSAARARWSKLTWLIIGAIISVMTGVIVGYVLHAWSGK